MLKELIKSSKVIKCKIHDEKRKLFTDNIKYLAEELLGLDNISFTKVKDHKITIYGKGRDYEINTDNIAEVIFTGDSILIKGTADKLVVGASCSLISIDYEGGVHYSKA